MFWANGPWHAAGGGGPACLIVGLLVFGALIAGGVWWWKRRSKPRPGWGSGSPGTGSGSPGSGSATERPSAEDILDERFARGDITDDEYMQRRSVLRENRGD